MKLHVIYIFFENVAKKKLKFNKCSFNLTSNTNLLNIENGPISNNLSN